MSIIGRDDRFITDAQGRALSGAVVYYCTQPATTSTTPPSPLATVYSDTSGDAGMNPVYADGFGHSVAYLSNGQLYTVVIDHPLFEQPYVLTDQTVPATGAGVSSLTPFAGIPIGTVDGTNRVFTLSNGGTPLASSPLTSTLIVTLNFPLTQGLGYTVSGTTITYANAPQPASGSVPADTIYAQGFLNS
jgi:hypothetical protein